MSDQRSGEPLPIHTCNETVTMGTVGRTCKACQRNFAATGDRFLTPEALADDRAYWTEIRAKQRESEPEPVRVVAGSPYDVGAVQVKSEPQKENEHARQTRPGEVCDLRTDSIGADGRIGAGGAQVPARETVREPGVDASPPDGVRSLRGDPGASGAGVEQRGSEPPRCYATPNERSAQCLDCGALSTCDPSRGQNPQLARLIAAAMRLGKVEREDQVRNTAETNTAHEEAEAEIWGAGISYWDHEQRCAEPPVLHRELNPHKMTRDMTRAELMAFVRSADPGQIAAIIAHRDEALAVAEAVEEHASHASSVEEKGK